jgi:hypothetical protein
MRESRRELLDGPQRRSLFLKGKEGLVRYLQR